MRCKKCGQLHDQRECRDAGRTKKRGAEEKKEGKPKKGGPKVKKAKSGE